jgi:hypothetical protein
MPKLEVGPIGLLPPSAARMGIFQPAQGTGMELVRENMYPPM